MGTPSFNVATGLLLLALAGSGSVTQASAESSAESSARETKPGVARPQAARSGATARAGADDETATAWGHVQIVVYKSTRSLALYRSGTFEKEYPVVLGLAPLGRKRHAYDARTPEGLYRVVGKRVHDRWQYFLALDYPNANDRSAYAQELRRGTIPDEDGEPFGIGDEIGIHGNDRQAEQAAGVDWTKGCVALNAADMAELAPKIPVGAPVWIVE